MNRAIRGKAIKLAMIVLVASVASGQPRADQNLDRVLPFAHTETAPALQEIAMAVRLVADIQQVSIDHASRALVLRGTADRVALAEWLFHELDKPAGGQPSAEPNQKTAAHEYRMPGNSDDVVRVFYLIHTETQQGLMEIATTIRTTAGIGRIFACSAPRALVLRGTADRIAMVEWLINEVDQPAGGQPLAQPQNPATREYRMPGNSDEVVKVLHPAHTETPLGLSEIVTTIRTIAEVDRIFACNTSRAVALRGRADRIALVEWLLNELDQPAGWQPPAQQGQDSATHQFRVPGTNGEVVRVFHLTHAETPQDLTEIATAIRTTVGIGRIFACSAPRALALRGTLDRIARAERLIEERDKPGAVRR